MGYFNNIFDKAKSLVFPNPQEKAFKSFKEEISNNLTIIYDGKINKSILLKNAHIILEHQLLESLVNNRPEITKSCLEAGAQKGLQNRSKKELKELLRNTSLELKALMRAAIK